MSWYALSLVLLEILRTGVLTDNERSLVCPVSAGNTTQLNTVV